MQNYFDVLIIGAGPAGLSMAKGLSQLNLKVLIVEKNSKESIENPVPDGRDIALTHLSKNILSELGAWEKFNQEDISEINEAKVFNGESSYFLGFSTKIRDRLAYIISNHHIRKAAYDTVKDDSNITIITDSVVDNFALNDDRVEAKISNGTEVVCKLLIAADTRFSETRKKVGISASMKDFGKSMLVCQMSHDLPHNNVANECFLYGNTLAVLPLNGNRSSVILTAKPAEIKGVQALPKKQFNEYIQNLFQHRYGKMILDSERFTYPLVAVYAHNFTAKRFALIGDAAVGMHPVTAHGFNFGLKAQHSLIHEIKRALNRKGDIASETVLRNYQKNHSKATRPLFLATNKIVDIYTNDSLPAKITRDFLLHAANNVLPIKNFITSKLLERPNNIVFKPLTALSEKILQRI